MNETKTVFIPQDVSQDAKTFLKERGYALKVGVSIDTEYLIQEIAECEAVLARTAEFSKDVICAGKRLKIIARHGVGVDNIDLNAAAENGIWVANAPLSNSLSVAEHTIALINALAKCLFRVSTEFRKGNFEIRNQLKGNEYGGKTLGIIGVGRIGSLVAKKAALGLDMKVLCCDPYVTKAEQYFELTDDLSYLLANSDFVSIHVPANDQTKKMLGKKEFELMKKSAYLINCARGSVINEPDLIEALKAGEIAGAALDVYEQEPPLMNNSLFNLENVIMTPHTAALTYEAADRMALHAAWEIDRVLSGELPKWPVNNPRVKVQ